MPSFAYVVGMRDSSITPRYVRPRLVLRVAASFPDGYMVDIDERLVVLLSPVARLLGHSLAAALGFCGLGVVALLPIAATRLLLWLGFAELATPLRILEAGLLFADIFLFAVVFLPGISVFLVEAIVTAKRRICKALEQRPNDE